MHAAACLLGRRTLARRARTLSILAALLLAVGVAGCSSSDDPPGGEGGSGVQDGQVVGDAATTQRDGAATSNDGAGGADGTTTPRDGGGFVDFGGLPPATCTFVSPKGGDTVKAGSTAVELSTSGVSAGSPFTLLVDNVQTATALVDAKGVVYFAAVTLSTPSSRVRLTADSVSGFSRVRCSIDIKVVAP